MQAGASEPVFVHREEKVPLKQMAFWPAIKTAGVKGPAEQRKHYSLPAYARILIWDPFSLKPANYF